MGQTSSSRVVYSTVKTEDDQVVYIYLKAEFMAMDTNRDGLLTKQEFIRLLMFLGYGGNDGRAEALVRAMHKGGNDAITIDEYYEALINNKEIMEKTSRMRVIFGCFDDKKDGMVEKTILGKRLKQMGYDVNEDMRRKFDEIDENKDGKISYEEFLRNHLKMKGYIS